MNPSNSILFSGIQRSRRRGRRSKRTPRWGDPRAIERFYAKEMAGLAREISLLIKENIWPVLPRLISEASRLRPDSSEIRADDWSDDIESLISSLRITIGGRVNARNQAIDLTARRISEFNASQRNNIIKRVIGVDVFRSEPWLEAELKSWAAANRHSIRGMADNLLTDVDGIAQRGVRSGTSLRDITRQMLDRFEIAENKAAFIARNEVGNLNGQLTKLRQQDLSITSYRWRNSQDERVRGNPSGKYPNARPSHWHREGKIFQWNDPPEGGHPGEDFNCRCYAEPVLDDILDELEES